jgi:hypothetical protein
MVAVTWALRATREVYHPWYARPDWLFLLIASMGVAVGWVMSRLGQWLPARAHGCGIPAVTWAVALPLWLGLAGAALYFAPGAAYLWLCRSAVAGLLLLVVRRRAARRSASLRCSCWPSPATLWLRDGLEILRFAVAMLGRMPYITPVYRVRGAGGACRRDGRAAVHRGHGGRAPAAEAIARHGPPAHPGRHRDGLAYTAPAYTAGRAAAPLRAGPAGSRRADLDVGSRLARAWGWTSAIMRRGWTLETAIGRPGSVPVGAVSTPFVFRSTQPSIGPPPADIAGFSLEPLEAGHELTVTVVPHRPAMTIAFVLPEGITPARSNLPGVVARPLDGDLPGGAAGGREVQRGSSADVDPERLREMRVVVTRRRHARRRGLAAPARLAAARHDDLERRVVLVDPGGRSAHRSRAAAAAPVTAGEPPAGSPRPRPARSCAPGRCTTGPTRRWSPPSPPRCSRSTSCAWPAPTSTRRQATQTYAMATTIG